MKIKIVKIISLILCILFIAPAASVNAETYVVDSDKNLIPVPDAYEVCGTIKNLGEAGFMNHPKDFIVGDDGYLYIADTENNRILKITKKGEVLRIFDHAFDKALKAPKGVFVEADGSIWIADTGNFRIVVITAEGEDKEEYSKPNSNLLDENFTFDPQSISASTTGYIYVLKGANLMKMDGHNVFRGYIGAASVGFSIKRFLIRSFGTKSQIERTLKQEPASYTNFVIGSDGMIYGILANAKTAQIRKLNSVGNNTYPADTYGFTLETEEGELQEPFFSDITVAENGILSLVDQNSGLIYQYDQDGNLLAAFGGIGDYKGTYQIPVGIDVDQDGYLYVLDYGTNAITIYEPTSFIKLVQNAVTLYGEGQYSESKKYWEQVLEIDSNYALAHQGVARVLGKEEQWKEAMLEYKEADDKEGYSEAYSEYRHTIFRNYFGFVVLITVVILGGAAKLFGTARRYTARWNHRIKMGGDIE